MKFENIKKLFAEFGEVEELGGDRIRLVLGKNEFCASADGLSVVVSYWNEHSGAFEWLFGCRTLKSARVWLEKAAKRA